MGRPRNDMTKFWSKVDRRGPDDCWLWQGYRNTTTGYGVFKIHYEDILAHRVSYFLTHGRWAQPCCLHTCDVRPCVNPAHLYEGDHKDNARDREVRGRNNWAVGERAHSAKLRPNWIRDIRDLYASGVMQRDIAAAYAIKQGTVSNICARKSWKHV